MTFTYTRTVKAYYDHVKDRYYNEEYDFNYEPSDDEIITALADILIGETNSGILPDGAYKLALGVVKEIIKDNDLKDALCDQYARDLKDWFEDEALESERGD